MNKIEYSKETLIELVNYAKEKLTNFKISEYAESYSFSYPIVQNIFTGFEDKYEEYKNKDSEIFKGILPISYEYINPLSIKSIITFSAFINISISIPKRRNSKIPNPLLQIRSNSPFFSEYNNKKELIIIDSDLIKKTFSDIPEIIDEKSLESYYYKINRDLWLNMGEIDEIALEYKNIESFFKRLYQLYTPKFQTQYRKSINYDIKHRENEINKNENYSFFEKVIRNRTEIEQFLKDKE